MFAALALTIGLVHMQPSALVAFLMGSEGMNVLAASILIALTMISVALFGDLLQAAF